MRKRILVVAVLALVLVAAFAPVAMAAGRSRVGHLNLYTKTPTVSGPWTIVYDGPSGKMNYLMRSAHKTSFVMNAHGLVPGDTYVLLNYRGFAAVQMVLGTGVADEYGDVHIKGTYDPTTLMPDPTDPTFVGAKVWLVDMGLLQTVSGGVSFTGWDPSMILFEGKGI